MDLRQNELKTLTLKLVIPLAIVSFVLFTKWWYTLPVDAPGTMYRGFPFPYIGSAWHTSLAFQFFVIEFIADVLVYFLIVLSLVLFVNRYLITVKVHKGLTILLWSLSAIVLGFSLLICSSGNNIFYIKRPYHMEIKHTGYQFLWNEVQRPED